jgi:hypothetical protein
MWPTSRAQQIQAKLDALRTKTRVKVYFTPSSETGFIDYFPEDLWQSLTAHIGQEFEIVLQGHASAIDVFIMTSHGNDLASALWDLRAQGLDAIIALWLWDNHSGHANNLRTALAADFIFPSHWYDLDYLYNPVSVLAAHAPACCAQWTPEASKRIFQTHQVARTDKLFAHYVDYPFSWRTPVLRHLANEMPAADVLLLDPSNRAPYFGKDRTARMVEWMSYKVSLILPLERDLSTRVFDGLLCGHVLLVPKNVADFDEVIPTGLQQDLGIVRFDGHDPSDIEQAHRRGLDIFDHDGEAGIRRRHHFVMENHMLINRLRTILTTILQFATGHLKIQLIRSGRAAGGLTSSRLLPYKNDSR